MPRHFASFVLLLSFVVILVACGDSPSPVVPAVPDQDQQNPDDGFNKTRIDTFILRAYGIDAVYLAGSANSWTDEDPAWAFTAMPDGYTWQLVKEVPDYLLQYKFVLHRGTETLWLTDPSAVEILPDGIHSDPAYWNAVRGRNISTPSPLASPLDRRLTVIYEISLNDFSATGTFAGAIGGFTSSSNIGDLGINALEFMPVTVPSYNGWGYDPIILSAPNPSFGTPTTFAMLVDTAHDRGMAVILDMVLNHMAGSNPLSQIDNFVGENHFTTTESNPWGMVELNWNDPALRDYLLESLIHWVDTYRIDGFRFDYVAGEPYSNWAWLRGELKSRYPDLLLIAEDFRYPAEGNAVTSAGYDAQWGGNHTDNWGGGGNHFNQVMITALTEQGFAWRGQTAIEVGAFGPAYNNMWAVANVLSPNSQYAGGVPGDGFSDIKYLESHDENRLVWSVETIGSTGAQSVGGLSKAKLGAVMSMTSVGIPMLYNGQEIGSGEFRPADPVTYKIDWNGGDASLRSAYQQLIQLRLNHPALMSENIFFHWRDGTIDQTEYTITYWRGTTTQSSEAQIVVAANFDHQDHTWTIPFPSSGYYARLSLDGGPIYWTEVTDGNLLLTVPASTAMLWVKADGISAVP